MITITVDEVDEDSTQGTKKSTKKRRLQLDSQAEEKPTKQVSTGGAIVPPRSPPMENIAPRDFYLRKLYNIPGAELVTFLRFFAATTDKRSASYKWITAAPRETEASKDQSSAIKDAVDSLSHPDSVALSTKLSSIWLRYLGVKARNARLKLTTV